jgi:hypothetical protein
LEEEVFDRVPTFCTTLEDRPFQDVVGKPRIQNESVIRNGFVKFILNKWGSKLTCPLLQPFITQGMKLRIEAAVKLGFDSVCWIYDDIFIARNYFSMEIT